MYSLLSVSPGDGVQIGAEAVVKVSVGLPNLLQHLDIQGELKMQNIACDLMSCDSLHEEATQKEDMLSVLTNEFAILEQKLPLLLSV